MIKMELSLFVIATGAILLFFPASMWMGIALLAIGTLVYMVAQKPASQNAVQKRYVSSMKSKAGSNPYASLAPFMQQYSQHRQPAGGFNWEVRDQEQEQIQSTFADKRMTRQVPQVKDGMLNLPLPVSPEIADLIDLKYSKPVGAKYSKVERDTDNQWIPG